MFLLLGLNTGNLNRESCASFASAGSLTNRPSVEFHERGKKHKENVEKRIKEVQKKGKEVYQAQKQLNMDLAAIEAAALKAYEKDLNIEPSKSKSESTSQSLETQTTETCSKGESTAECLISYEGSQPTMQCSHGWNIGQAPEGYFYYYNETTQEILRRITQPAKSNKLTCSVQNEKKRSNEKETKQEEVKSSPYGQWTPVQTFEPPPQPPPQTIKAELSNKNDTKQDTATEAVKTEVKFKERSTPKMNFRSGGDGNEVAFKKRKLNPDKKRNIRQTDPNKKSSSL
ncbi:WW domain binding protein 4 [Desmophyllum pertusum]|uniref:WW domain binding protein 4 n=1 Tax=Desmophyllum pertusum TaxID=174260 RepID=A0A9W9Z8Y5_9CNID|nr:WW domain binding protein 4 [Desmophyllum pertusum]